MNERSLPLLPLGVLALLVILTFWLSQFVQPAPVKSDAKLRHDPDLIVDHFAARKLSADGDVQYKLRAEKMIHYADDDSSRVSDILFTAVQPGKPLLTATAPQGRMSGGTDLIVLEGNVKVVTEASAKQPELTLNTPTLTLDNENNTVKSDAGVSIVSGNSHIEAVKMTMNTESRNMKLRQVAITLEKAAK